MAYREKPTGARAAKRGVWFFMRTIMMITGFALLCYGVFTTAMNATNLYIIATEGLQLRAECILQDGPKEDLREFFTNTYLSKDAMLSSSGFDDYFITGFDYSISVESIVSWPWSSTATMVLVERMDSMSGSIHEDKKPENAPADAEYPLPEWEGGRYRLHFSRHDDRWYIYQMVMLDVAPEVKPLRTPDMRMSPRPAYTTTPPTLTPTPSAESQSVSGAAFTPGQSPEVTPEVSPGESPGPTPKPTRTPKPSAQDTPDPENMEAP